MTKKTQGKIHILGAGLAGLTAAVDLAKNGYEVLVLERAGSIGIGHYHPSLHATPIDLKWLCGFIGLDISSSFQEFAAFRSYFDKTCYNLKPAGYYVVERGARKTSIDIYLHKIALTLGVKFEFTSTINDHAQLPPGSIIATGLSPEIYQSLGIPLSYFYGAAFRFETKRANELVSIFDNSIGDYYYHCVANGLLFAHMFQRMPVSQKTLDNCLDYLIKHENFSNYKMQKTINVMPGWSIKGPRLFMNDKILAGTISGMIDPLMGFGITGAMISGKIAAMAVYDKEKALLEFKRYSKNWHSNFILRKILNKLPFSAKAQEALLIKAPVPVKKFFLQSGKLAIPGVDEFPLMEVID